MALEAGVPVARLLTSSAETTNIVFRSLRIHGEESGMITTRRRPGLHGAVLLIALATALAACSGSPAGASTAADPADGVTIDNATGTAVRIAYEQPDGATEPVVELQAGEQVVIDAIFAGKDGLCRTGRFVALATDGTEIDELYLVCKGRSWTVETSGAN
jgi:hypothetical protein